MSIFSDLRENIASGLRDDIAALVDDNPFEVVATGHRPPRLGGYHEGVRLATVSLARNSLLALGGVDSVTLGMALGWDQAVAEACIDLSIPFTAALPFATMGDRWPAASRKLRDKLLSRASRVEIVGGDGAYVQRFTVRDKWMVDHVTGPEDVCLALWDGVEKGGTFATVSHARIRDLLVVNAWEGSWLAHSGRGMSWSRDSGLHGADD